LKIKKKTEKTPTEKAEFDDAWGHSHEYGMVYYPARVGIRLKLKVGQLVRLRNSVSIGEGMTEAEGIMAFAGMLPSLCENIIELGNDKFMCDLLSSTWRDGKRLNDASYFDGAFAGNYGELYSVLMWVITENFKSFFSIPWKDLLKKALPKSGDQGESEEATNTSQIGL
jgi:hypothetical protein